MTDARESRRSRGARREARPLDLADYLREHADELSELWSEGIGARDLGQGTQFNAVVGRFVTHFVSCLPWLIGPHGPHVQALWDRTAELFGMMAAKRGLAAGEVIEEFQILRELLIRKFFDDPPAEGPPSLRDTLRLNRIVDSGVTHASVGHTDVLFFQFLEAQEPRVVQTPQEIVVEAEEQLELVAQELAQTVGTSPVEAARNSLDN